MTILAILCIIMGLGLFALDRFAGDGSAEKYGLWITGLAALGLLIRLIFIS